MSHHFRQPYENFGGNVTIELDLCNYAKKKNWSERSNRHTCTLASKTDLASLKTKVDNLDVDKLESVPADLSTLRNVVDNDDVKKSVL